MRGKSKLLRSHKLWLHANEPSARAGGCRVRHTTVNTDTDEDWMLLKIYLL